MTQAKPSAASKQRHNFLAFGSDYMFFALSLAFLNLNTVLPTFVKRLGASPTLVGFFSTALMLGWTLPQLAAGNLASRFERKKPMLMRAALIGRPFTLLVPAVIILTMGEPAWLNLVVTLATFAIFFATDAFASIPWLDLLGRAFPAERRGRVISTWQVSKAVGILGVSAIVGYVLGPAGPEFPINYAVLFTAMAICLMLSTIGISLIYEPPVPDDEPLTTTIAWSEFGQHIARIWGSDPRFRRLAASRVVFTLGAMSFPFYVIYATDELLFPDQTLGLFIFAQTVGASLASVLLGRAADRHGAQRVTQIGTLIAASAPLLALIVTLSGGELPRILSWGFVWVYICIGLSDNLMMLGFLNYLLDITPPGQRPIYMGIFSSIAAIGVIGPTLAGWLLGLTSYRLLFTLSLGFGLLAAWLVKGLPPARASIESTTPVAG